MYYGTITAPGGVSSNAKDMSKWLIFHMKHGESAAGARVVSEQLMKVLEYQQKLNSFISKVF